jgi:hypothetical protein
MIPLYLCLYQGDDYLVLVPVPVGPGLGQLPAQLAGAGTVLVEDVVQAPALFALSDDERTLC